MKRRFLLTLTVFAILVTTSSCSIMAGQGNKGTPILSLGVWGTDDKENKRLYSLFNELHLSLKYSSDIPKSVNDLLKYPIVMFGTCTLYPADEIQIYKHLLADYVSRGGSLVYLSGNGCKFTGEDKLSKSQMANVISQQWGMKFLGEDYFTESDEVFGNANPIQGKHPIVGADALYNTRYTTMEIVYPATVLYETKEGPFLAIYDVEGSGTVVGIASEFFLTDNSKRAGGQKIHDDANYTFLKNMFNWLIQQSQSKMH